jgi:hypothetical protein
MGLLTFSINVTLDGCVDHQEGIADDETHAFFTRLRVCTRINPLLRLGLSDEPA